MGDGVGAGFRDGVDGAGEAGRAEDLVGGRVDGGVGPGWGRGGAGAAVRALRAVGLCDAVGDGDGARRERLQAAVVFVDGGERDARGGARHHRHGHGH